MFEDLRPHLVELRKRLAIALSATIVAFLICFFFWEPIMHWMIKPLEVALGVQSKIIYLKPQEALFTAIKVSFFAALMISLPIIFWQIWKFIAPGLYDHEKKLVLPFTFFATAMFLSGAAFAYYLVIPLGLDFLVNFGNNLFTAMPSIAEYIGFLTKILIAFGITFELPVVTFFLAKIGLVTEQTLIGFFRYAIVCIFILSAILTPPDIISQFLMAIPLILLYGISILIAKSVNPAPKEDDEEEDDDKNTQSA